MRKFLVTLRSGETRRAHGPNWYAVREQCRALFGDDLEDVTECPDSLVEELMQRRDIGDHE